MQVTNLRSFVFSLFAASTSDHSATVPPKAEGDPGLGIYKRALPLQANNKASCDLIAKPVLLQNTCPVAKTQFN